MYLHWDCSAYPEVWGGFLLRRSQYVLKLLWFVGLMLLLFVALHIETIVKRHVDATLNETPLFWSLTCVPFFLGLYLGLLFMRPKLSVNLSFLLCIFLPAFIISFYPPIAYTIASMNSHNGSFTVPIRSWMMALISNGLVPVLAGTTLMVGLFGVRKD